MIESRANARWLPEEDDILRTHYPRFPVLLRLLPGRTKDAMAFRAGTLGLRRRVHIWTGAELKELRSLRQAGFTWPQLRDQFPGKSLVQPQARLRSRARLKLFGLPLLDQVRQRAFDRGIRLSTLDRQAGTARYFSHGSPIERLEMIDKAARVLGGRLTIEWGEN